MKNAFITLCLILEATVLAWCGLDFITRWIWPPSYDPDYWKEVK